MYQDLAIEVLKSIGRFFLNPLLYIGVLFAILIGYVRVKRERKSFRMRVLWGWTETIGFLSQGWMLAVCISLLSVTLGLTVPVEWFFLFVAFSLLSVLTFFYHTASAVYPIVLASCSLWLLDVFGQSWSFAGVTFSGESLTGGLLVVAPLFAGFLLLAEGLLIRKHGATSASPTIKTSERGLPAVSFLTKRLWLLPILFIVPGDAIQAYVPYWPQFTFGHTSFSLLFAPVVIGFQQSTKKTLPLYFYPKVSRSVILLGNIVIVGAILSFSMPAIGMATLALAFLGRMAISIGYAISERQGGYAVAPQSAGVMIAGVLPDSPAERMGLLVGECIRKVNGQVVHTERELYEAVQINAAHCRIEVLNHDGEVRLRQHVIYRHDHHQLGLLLVR